MTQLTPAVLPDAQQKKIVFTYSRWYKIILDGQRTIDVVMVKFKRDSVRVW